MKSITIAGNVTKDAETRDTRSGSVTSFGVAVNRRNKDDGAIFFDVGIFGKRGEALAQYITKGSKIVVVGDFDIREHDGKTYFKVTANDVTLQGGGQQNRGEHPSLRRDGGGQERRAMQTSGGYESRPTLEDDGIPF